MSWTSYVAKGAIMCVASGLLAVPAFADVMVVRASGPSAAGFKPGTKLSDNAPLVLKAGDQLVLLDQGGTRTVRGPGRFTATESSAPTSSVALAALTGSNTRRARVGAVRSAGPAASTQPPSVWFVDPAKGGTVCVAGSTRPAIWRSEVAAAGTTKLDGGGKSAEVRWAPGQASQMWPAALPATDGATYTVSPGGPPVRFVTLGAAPTDLVALADALLTRGCETQVDMLIATTRK